MVILAFTDILLELNLDLDCFRVYGRLFLDLIKALFLGNLMLWGSFFLLAELPDGL